MNILEDYEIISEVELQYFLKDYSAVIKLVKPVAIKQNIKYFSTNDIKTIQNKIEGSVKPPLINKEDLKNIYRELAKPQYNFKFKNFNLKKVRRKAIQYLNKRTNIKRKNEGIIRTFVINRIRHKYTNYDELVTLISKNNNINAILKNEMIKILKKRINTYITRQL